MDVRASLNDVSLSVVSGDGQISFLENDSFFAKNPPMAASTVGRTKSRRFMHESEMGSFLDEEPRRVSPFNDLGPPYAVGRSQGPFKGSGEHHGGDLPPGTREQDWSVVNTWCRENNNKMDNRSEYDGVSSLGILDVDDMDVSSTNLLLEGPMDELRHREADGEKLMEDSQGGTLMNSQSNQSSQYSHHRSSMKEQYSSDNAGWSSSQGSMDSKPEPFASSQVTTVKKSAITKQNTGEPVTAVIRQMLFGQAPIGEEGEETDVSVHIVELGNDDLQELDDDFDMNLTACDDSDKEEGGTTPVATSVSAGAGKLDSMYLRPGVAGEESNHTARLPYLSKVSLFEGGSESEIDTEDELEQARKLQGARAEAAGEASQQDTSRPGVVGRCSDERVPSRRQVPIAQRQSAEGDAVSPIPGDGGGGGDGSSGSESDDIRGVSQSNTGHGFRGSDHSEEQEEQRVRPMGDDLLSEIRTKRYNRDSAGSNDTNKLSSRYLMATSQFPDDTGGDQINVDDYFLTQDLSEGCLDFDPSNRLEASGFNADDDQRPASNPFGAMASSFGSFGLPPDRFSGSLLGHEEPSGHSAERGNSSGSMSRIRPDTGGSGGEDGWRQLEESIATSRGSHASSRARSTSPTCHGNLEYQSGQQRQSRDGSLGCRSAASGSPSSLTEKRMAATGSPSISQPAPPSNFSVTAPSNSVSAESKNEVFKMPDIPAPKIASQNSFRKSYAKRKSSCSSSRQMSGTGSSASSTSSGSEYVDLAVKMSLATLTGEAAEQRAQLKRVPSIGGTSMMDLTVNDDEFFGNVDALAMLDDDEELFENENKIRQDEVMNVKEPSSDDDSWQYQSIMTISRPSWLDDPRGEELVRISVGTFMRSRTEVLGSLEGKTRQPRPDFGMKFNSPPRVKTGQSIEEEVEGDFTETRTSGVGQYENTATPFKTVDGGNASTLDVDDTLTMSKLGLPPIATVGDSKKLSLGEMSLIINSSGDMKSKVQQLLSLHASKSRKDQIKPTDDTVADAPNTNSLPPPSRESVEELWSSPNASSCAASTVGLFERLDQFQFSSGTKQGKANDQPQHNLFNKQELPIKDRDVDDRELRKKDVYSHRMASPKQSNDNISVSSNRSKGSGMDHGYLLGHHIPDGTEYSELSDYSHMNHKGMEREDVAGMDEDGILESRGFDMLEKRSSARGMSNGETSSANEGKNILGEKRIQASSNILPRQGSSSPVIKGVPSYSRANSTRVDEQDIVNRDDGDSQARQARMESWTQTSTVLKQSIGLQPDLEQINYKDPGLSNKNDDHKTNDTFENEFRKENLPPKEPLASFQHDLLRNTQSAVPQKPHLLTKTSLMKTEFAEDNLHRDFNMEVMDKIYDLSHPSAFNQLRSQHNTTSRDTMESVHWTQLNAELTRMSDIYGQGGRMPLAESTPFPDKGLSLTTSKLSSDCASLSMVEAPNILQFSDACCVGISKTESLELTNPTDRWMECLLQVKSLEVDGRPTELTNFPFEFRQQRLIINPNKTEIVDIMFLPKYAGAYVAQLQVFSSAFMRKEDIKQNMIPANVTLQAIAEKPWIKVVCDNDESSMVDFGEMAWGSCRDKTLTIYNHGLAAVPLCLAITSNKAWHCFSFTGTSDVSIISRTRHMPAAGQGRSVININIPGSAHSDKNCSFVQVWCKPPDKQISKAQARQPPEEFTCTVNIDVDTPSSKLPTLASVRLKVKVGIQKLHIQSRIQEVRLAAAPMKTQDSRLKITNAGNLGFEVSFGFTCFKEVFSVKPNVTYLPPGSLEEISVAFHPKHANTPSYESELLMYIQPEGPLFEMKMMGKVLQPSSTGPVCILCDHTSINFGGVPVNRTLVKRYQLINKNDEPITMKVESRVDDVQVADSPEPTAAVSKVKEIYLETGATVSVYVQFKPICQSILKGRIAMKTLNTNASKFSVAVTGYGGSSKLVCSDKCQELTSVRGYPCVGIFDKSSTEQMQSIFINNSGCRQAKVRVAVYQDLSCQQCLSSGEVRVQPSEFLLQEGSSQILDITARLKPGEEEANILKHGVGAVICLSYVDDVEMEKPYRSKLVIGLTRRSETSNQPPDIFATPTPAPRNMSRIPPQNIILPVKQNNLNFTDKLLTHRSDDIVTIDAGSKSDNTGGWEIRPSQMLLYCSNKGPSDEFDKFYIHNHRNRDISFEMVWPGGMLTLKPDRGIVKARELVSVMIFPTSEACKRLDQLPWNGSVHVQCDGASKLLRVQIRHDVTADNRSDPGMSPRMQIPVSMTQPALSSKITQGTVEVSKTSVQFPPTMVGKVAQESIVLTNVGTDMVRWMFTSFAPPYLRKHPDKKKELVRVTYKVFDISRLFGKLNRNSSLQLLLQFMPRSAGAFMQYYDLQLTGNHSGTSHLPNNDSLRIQFSGEGLEEPEVKDTNMIPERTAALLPLLTEKTNKIQLQNDHLSFSSVGPGEKLTHKVELKNNHTDIIRVDVVPPKSPFCIKHTTFKISGKRYLRLPVDFSPTHLGVFRDVVKFHTATGQSLQLTLSGECSLDDTLTQQGHL